MARLSEAPMRVCTASNTPMRADAAGTKEPTWRSQMRLVQAREARWAHAIPA